MKGTILGSTMIAAGIAAAGVLRGGIYGVMHTRANELPWLCGWAVPDASLNWTGWQRPLSRKSRIIGRVFWPPSSANDGLLVRLG
jgi:hypothetical protein